MSTIAQGKARQKTRRGFKTTHDARLCDGPELIDILLRAHDEQQASNLAGWGYTSLDALPHDDIIADRVEIARVAIRQLDEAIRANADVRKLPAFADQAKGDFHNAIQLGLAKLVERWVTWLHGERASAIADLASALEAGPFERLIKGLVALESPRGSERWNRQQWLRHFLQTKKAWQAGVLELPGVERTRATTKASMSAGVQL